MIDPRLHDAMRQAAEERIHDALRGRAPGWPHLPRNEVTAVQAVTVGGASQVAAEWRRLLRPLGIRVDTHAVFCHSSPQVGFKPFGAATPPVELADLLLVVDSPFGGGFRRRARLVQAKVAGRRGGVGLGRGKPTTQFMLLSHWPLFWFTAAGLSQAVWNLRDSSSLGNVADSAVYGVVSRSFASWRQVDAVMPMSMVGHPSLGREIADMALGLAGRPARIAGGDGWSDLVRELMGATYAAVYGTSVPHARGQSSSSAFLTWDASTPTGRTTVAFQAVPPVDGAADERPDGPLSVVYVAIGRMDEAVGWDGG